MIKNIKYGDKEISYVGKESLKIKRKKKTISNVSFGPKSRYLDYIFFFDLVFSIIRVKPHWFQFLNSILIYFHVFQYSNVEKYWKTLKQKGSLT